MREMSKMSEMSKTSQMSEMSKISKMSETFKMSSENMLFTNTVKPVYNGHPQEPQKSGRCTEGGCCSEVAPKYQENFEWVHLGRGFRPVVVDRWSLFRGGHLHRFDYTLEIAECDPKRHLLKQFNNLRQNCWYV